MFSGRPSSRCEGLSGGSRPGCGHLPDQSACCKPPRSCVIPPSDAPCPLALLGPPSLCSCHPSPLCHLFQVIIIQPQVQTQPESTAESRPPTEEPSQGAQATKKKKEDRPPSQENPEVGWQGSGVRRRRRGQQCRAQPPCAVGAPRGDSRGEPRPPAVRLMDVLVPWWCGAEASTDSRTREPGFASRAASVLEGRWVADHVCFFIRNRNGKSSFLAV